MKKRLSIILISVILVMAFAFGASAYIAGDTDNDFLITAADARFTLRLSVGLEECEKNSDQFFAADADNDGKITGISVISQTETAGLGAVCAEKTSKGEDFRNQYAGKSGEITVIKSGEPADNEIVAISGATISSKAVTAGINAALDCVKALIG